jgi:hypothetical protein
MAHPGANDARGMDRLICEGRASQVMASEIEVLSTNSGTCVKIEQSTQSTHLGK